MTVYAMSNVDGVGVPMDGGGCGFHHRRPEIDGVRAPLFAVDCPPCEDYLLRRLGDQWTRDRWNIPLTEDEKQRAEFIEKLAQQRATEEAAERGQQIAREISAEANQVHRPVTPVTARGPEPVTDGVSSEELARQDAETDLHILTQAQLRVKAREAGKSTSGSKADLITRLEGSGE